MGGRTMSREQAYGEATMGVWTETRLLFVGVVAQSELRIEFIATANALRRNRRN